MKTSKLEARSLLILMTVAAFLFFYRLGDRPLRNPDEGRYAEIARNMVVGRDWVEPQVFGVDYLRKPPMFYWLLAVSFKLNGFHEWAARAVPAFFGLSGVLLFFYFVNKQLGYQAAFCSALILTTNFWYLHVGRYLVMDMVFSFFLTGALFCLFAGLYASRAKKILYLSAYALTGCAFLTKGPVALVLTGFPFGIYLLMARRWRDYLKEGLVWQGALLFTAIVAPWFVAISKREPEFLRLFFVHENLNRYVSSGYEHQQPWYFYLPCLAAIIFPWFIFPKIARKTGAILRERSQHREACLYSALCIVCMTFFYSASKSKLATYILPAVPFFCLLIGASYSKLIELGERWKLKHSSVDWFYRILLVASVMLLFSHEKINRVSFLTGHAVIPLLPYIAASGILFSILCLKAIQRQRPVLLLVWTAAFLGTLSMLGVHLLEMDSFQKTSKNFAEILKPQLKPGDKLFIYEGPGPFYDFPFYLNRAVRVVGREGELELYKEDYDPKEKPILKPEFEKILASDMRVFCLIRRSDYPDIPEAIRHSLHIVMQDEKKILFGNKVV